MSATPTTQFDITGGFTTTRHSGELPWGASFGFSNDNEVALPYRSRTNDMDVGAQWTNSARHDSRRLQRVVVPQPGRHADLGQSAGADRLDVGARSRPNGAMALQFPPDAEHGGLCRSSRTGHSSRARWRSAGANNNEDLLPFTINSALPQFTLPRQTAEASAHTVATNVDLVSRPADDWRFSARFRRYDYNNRHAGDDDHELVSSTTTRRRNAARPAVRSSVCAQPQYPRHRRDMDRSPSGGADVRVHEQPQRLRLSHLRVDQRERDAPEGRRGRPADGSRSAPTTSMEAAPARVSTRRCSSRSANSRACGTTISPTARGTS